MTRHVDDPVFWQVQVVFDPDGTGQDFAYTIGLATRGIPELHLWSRPTDGDDPGADFVLSRRDCANLLNRWARELLAGELGAGSVRVVGLDGGASTAEFTATGPVPAREVDAWGAGDAPMLSMRWTLRRPPVAPSAPLSPEQKHSLRLEVARTIADSGPHAVPGPALRVLGDRVGAVAPVEVFGPRAPLVAARLGQLVTRDSGAWMDLLEVALTDEAEDGIGPRGVMARASAVARPSGRVAAVEAAFGAARPLLEALVAADAETGVYADLLAWVCGGVPVREQDAWRGRLGSLIVDVAAALLCADVLGDELDGPARAAVDGWRALLSQVSR